MKPYAPESGVLAGSIEGKKAFGDMVNKTVHPPRAEVCFLDFAGIGVATSSFLRDSIIAYRNHARTTWLNLYPVAANMTPRVREELETYLLSRGDALVLCKLDRSETAKDVQLVGQIDGKQLETLQVVQEMGEVDAPELVKRFGDEIGSTAWNNRLSALSAKGILIATSSGRNKRYRPVLGGLKYGT
jgi:hypothetical protein